MEVFIFWYTFFGEKCLTIRKLEKLHAYNNYLMHIKYDLLI